VITPGSLEKSRIWDLVGRQQPFKMPQGDSRITRTHWNSLRTWILEGAKYDGGDPKRLLRSIVPTESEKRNAEIARTSPEQFRERWRTRAEELWRRALPNETPRHFENASFLVYGNVTNERLEETARWAADGLAAVQSFFDDHTAVPFKGGLTIFVLKDRFSYLEFNQTIEKREPQPTIHGHAVVTPDLVDAYIAVQNLPDAATDDAPGARNNLLEQLAAAYLLGRSDKKLPDWLVLGSGRVLTASSLASVVPASQLPTIYRLAGSLDKRDDLFADGSFSPSAARDVGASVIAYLQEKHGKPQFQRFVKSLQSGMAQADAFRDAYGLEPGEVAAAYLSHAAEAAGKPAN
jgi:hypothetical protein